ncbi:DUF3248 domain-containing protein [Deinococcus lacus]|uniref:DUF3248 domain-containing protein n=1 Tax=Deinococcus lacus TaxID=392561 RepID=A0ABW1YAM1_9DEIO
MSSPLAALPAALAEQLEQLGHHLVWRIGKEEGEEAIVVRVGLAGATPRFAHLPRLRSASDPEIQAALQAGLLRIDWID